MNLNFFILLVVAFTAVISKSFAQPYTKLYKDIYMQERNGQSIVFGNDSLTIEVDKLNGNWVQLNTVKHNRNYISVSSSPSVDVKLNNIMLLKDKVTAVKKYYSTVNKSSHSVSLHIVQSPGNEYELITTYILYTGKPVIERLIKLTYLNKHTASQQKFESFYFTIPGLLIGESKDCVADTPGPFWPSTFTPAQTPYDSLKKKTIHYHSAPDGSFGVFSVTNIKLKTCLATWMKTDGDTYYNTSVLGNGLNFSLVHKNNKGQYLLPEKSVISDTQQIVILPDFNTALKKYREVAVIKMPLHTGTPSWVKEAVILEIFPAFFKNGFKELAGKLPFYKDIGFNTIYIMPHWEGGYSPVNLYEVDKKFGTKEDLQKMVQTAHRLGMRVLFDMVIHGFNKRSAVVQQHPEFFYKDYNDTLMIHPSWKSVMTDFMNPAYQKYMEDYVLYDQQTFNNDGYRVDAASYKGPNWNRHIPYAAYKSGTASTLMMKIMYDAMKKKNRDIALLSEVFGPVFYTVNNFVHDNQTEAMSYVIKKMEEGTYHLKQYKKHMEYVYAALPNGAVRVFYTRNHDTSWFYEFYGYSPTFMNFEVIHALFGVPEVFAGDPNYKFNPDDDPSIYKQYKRIFSARMKYPEFVRGNRLLKEVDCDNDDIFTGMAKDRKHCSVAIISASSQDIKLTVRLREKLQKKKPLIAKDILTDMQTTVTVLSGNRISLTVRPYQAMVVRLY